MTKDFPGEADGLKPPTIQRRRRRRRRLIRRHPHWHRRQRSVPPASFVTNSLCASTSASSGVDASAESASAHKRLFRFRKSSLNDHKIQTKEKKLRDFDEKAEEVLIRFPFSKRQKNKEGKGNSFPVFPLFPFFSDLVNPIFSFSLFQKSNHEETTRRCRLFQLILTDSPSFFLIPYSGDLKA